MINLEEVVEKAYKKKGRNIKKMAVGSTLRVNTRIKEGGKERIQAFEGVLIAKRGRGLNEMITVRKVSYGGIGVERTFPLHSPMIESIKIMKPGETKRAKLYYLREKFGRKAKREARKFDSNMGKEELDALNAEPASEAPKAETPKAEEKPAAEAPKPEAQAEPKQEKK